MRTTRCPRASGLTLIEILVSMAVLGVVAGIALPALSRARGVGERARCMANLRSQGTAITAYRGDNNDLLPWAVTFMDVRLNWLDPMPALGRYLDVEVPWLGEFGEIHTGEPWTCPSDRGEGLDDGVSYVYTPYDLMAIDPSGNPGRIITLIYETNNWLPLMKDEGLLHGEHPSIRSTNVLLIDGSVEPGDPAKHQGR